MTFGMSAFKKSCGPAHVPDRLFLYADSRHEPNERDGLAMTTARFVDRRPVLYTMLMTIAMIAVYVLAGAVSAIGHLDKMAQVLLGDTILAVMGLRIVARRGWWQEAGLAPAPTATAWALASVPLLLAFRGLADGVAMPAPGYAVVMLVAALSVGFVEETFFRGIFMRALQPMGARAAVAGSTLLFGARHALNLLGGQSGLMTAIQIGWAFAVGFCYATFRLRTRSLWPLIAAHALTDFVAWLGTAAEPSALSLVSVVVAAAGFLGYGAWLWRSTTEQ
jgi:membrane protease YdiL (CAAX protease family)